MVLRTLRGLHVYPATSRHRISSPRRDSQVFWIYTTCYLRPYMMDSSYTQHSQPPQPSYSMAPGVPPPPNDASYRRDATGPQFHSATASQHQQNGQTYAYNPNSLPSLPPQRAAHPDQIMGSENGPAPTNLAVTLPMGQMVNAGAPEPPSHSMIELGRRYTYV